MQKRSSYNPRDNKKGDGFKKSGSGDRPFRPGGPKGDGGDRRFEKKDEFPRRRREDGDRPFRPGGPKGESGDREFKPRGPRREDGDREFKPRGPKREDGDREFKSRGPRREDGDREFKPRSTKREDGDREFKPRGPKREDGDREFKSRGPRREDGDREFKPRGPKREDGDREFKSRGPRREDGDREFKPRGPKREDGDREFKSRGPRREDGDRPFRPGGPKGDSGPRGRKSFSDDKPEWKERKSDRRSFGDKEERPDRSESAKRYKDIKGSPAEFGKKKKDFDAEDRKETPADFYKKKEKPNKKYDKDDSYSKKRAKPTPEEDAEFWGDDSDWEFEESKKDTRKKPVPAATYPMPLNKYIAHSGECSRRDAAELVRQGKAKVNGELIDDPGYKVNEGDQVTLSGKKLKPTKGLVYILLNKPKGFITTNEDPQGRRTVMELVKAADAPRLYPVGRLDRATTGLLLITNDGDLAQKLAHPSYNIKKVYHVTLDKRLTQTDFDKILAGVELEDGKAEVDEMAYLEKNNEIGLEIHSGRNRIVRRIFESLGYTVEKLDRMMYAGLTKKNLPRSRWRYLDENEVRLLKHFKQ